MLNIKIESKIGPIIDPILFTAPAKLSLCAPFLGFPKFIIKGTSLKNLKKLFKNRKFKIHLSLSDDKPWAIATVIIFLY